MGDRVGDGETAVSGFCVPLIFILYYNTKAISGLLVTRKLLFYSNITQESVIVNIKTRFYQPHRALLGFLSGNYWNQSQNNTVFVQQEKVDRAG